MKNKGDKLVFKNQLINSSVNQHTIDPQLLHTKKTGLTTRVTNSWHSVSMFVRHLVYMSHVDDNVWMCRCSACSPSLKARMQTSLNALQAPVLQNVHRRHCRSPRRHHWVQILSQVHRAQRRQLAVVLRRIQSALQIVAGISVQRTYLFAAQTEVVNFGHRQHLRTATYLSISQMSITVCGLRRSHIVPTILQLTLCCTR